MMLFPKINPNYKRRAPKRRNVTRITKQVRDEVLKRSEGKCERCGRSRSYAFEMAHLKSAAQLGRGDDPANIALLCGPSTNSHTCHHWADSTKLGREWRMQKRKELIKYYEQPGKIKALK